MCLKLTFLDYILVPYSAGTQENIAIPISIEQPYGPYL